MPRVLNITRDKIFERHSNGVMSERMITINLQSFPYLCLCPVSSVPLSFADVPHNRKRVIA